MRILLPVFDRSPKSLSTITGPLSVRILFAVLLPTPINHFVCRRPAARRFRREFYFRFRPASGQIKEQIGALLQPSDNRLATKLFGNSRALTKEKLRQKATGRWIIHPCSNFRYVINSAFTARRYVSAGTSYGPVSVSVSVCLSQVGVLSKRSDGIIWFLAWGGLLSTRPTLCFKEIQLSTK